MKPIIYEDESGAWDAVDVYNIIKQAKEAEKEIAELKLKSVSALLKATDVVIEQQSSIQELHGSIAIYCREELGHIDFENDRQAVEYFLKEHKG